MSKDLKVKRSLIVKAYDTSMYTEEINEMKKEIEGDNPFNFSVVLYFKITENGN